MRQLYHTEGGYEGQGSQYQGGPGNNEPDAYKQAADAIRDSIPGERINTGSNFPESHPKPRYRIHWDINPPYVSCFIEALNEAARELCESVGCGQWRKANP